MALENGGENLKTEVKSNARLERSDTAKRLGLAFD